MNRTDAALMKLVFRVGDIGFSLIVEHLVEVVQLRADELAPPDAEEETTEAGTFRFRNEPVALLDLRRAFGLTFAGLPEEMSVLVLSGERGLWGALVGTVEGVYPEDSFTTRELPISLICTGQKLYSQLDIWRGEPLVNFEPCKIDRLRAAGCL